MLWRCSDFDAETFAPLWERVFLDRVTVVECRTADEGGRLSGRCVIYLKEGVSAMNGIPYAGGAVCAPGDRILPWYADPGAIPEDGGYMVQSVEERALGSGRIRHAKLTAR